MLLYGAVSRLVDGVQQTADGGPVRGKRAPGALLAKELCHFLERFERFAARLVERGPAFLKRRFEG
jgi:hypothetical protein